MLAANAARHYGGVWAVAVWCYTGHGAGWFSQFTLALAVAALFCIDIPAHSRGTDVPPGLWAYTRMSMGWRWAVFVAQGVLIFLLHKAGIKTPAVPWPSGA